ALRSNDSEGDSHGLHEDLVPIDRRHDKDGIKNLGPDRALARRARPGPRVPDVWPSAHRRALSVDRISVGSPREPREAPRPPAYAGGAGGVPFVPWTCALAFGPIVWRASRVALVFAAASTFTAKSFFADLRGE